MAGLRISCRGAVFRSGSTLTGLRRQTTSRRSFRRPVQSPVFPAIRLWTELPQPTPSIPLADYARDLARNICPDVDIGSVSLLTFPRILGVAFNPVSIYLLRDRDGADAMYIYEVRNTFGDMHSYVGRATKGEAALEAQKIFHVSPFFLSAGISPSHACPARVTSGPRFDAIFRSRDRPADRNIAWNAGKAYKFRCHQGHGGYRPMAVAALISIHVEAARLWWKRVPFHSRPEPPNSWSRADDVGGR